MRSFDEINEAVRIALGTHASDTLLELATEFVQIGSKQGLAAAANTRGSALLVQSMFAEAMQEFERSLEIYEQIEISSGIAAVLVNIGACHRLAGDLKTATVYFDRARQIYTDIANERGLASVLQNLGSILVDTGDYGSALEQYMRSLELWISLQDDNAIAKVYLGIGQVYRIVGDYPKALENFERGVAIGAQHDIRHLIASASSSIGIVYQALEQYSKSHEHFVRALEIHQAMGNRLGTATALTNLAISEIQLADTDAAATHFQQAIAISHEIGDVSGLTKVQLNLAQLLLDMQRLEEFDLLLQDIDPHHSSDPRLWISWHTLLTKKFQLKNDDERADHELRVALEIASQHGLLAELSVIHKNLRDHARNRSDLEAYVTHNDEYVRIKESINGKATAERIALQQAERTMTAERALHEKHLAILHSTLPKHVADRVARGEVVNDSFDNAAVLFLDVVGFTTNSSELGANVLVELLQQIFTTFDAICAEHNVMKIKTIGDSYMAVAFPSEHHIEDLAAVALAMQTSEFTWPHKNERVMFRIGMHCGPVVAGVLGTERMQYDVWGDTVNVASRMESSGEAGRVHVSAAFAANLQSNTEYRIQNSMSESQNTESHEVSHASVARPSVAQSELVTRHSSLVTFLRGSFDIKGKGMMKTFWLESLTT